MSTWNVTDLIKGEAILHDATSPPSRQHTVGIVGSGRAAAKLHLPALQKIPSVRLSAICDVDPNSLNDVAETFDIAHRYANVKEMPDKSDPDIVAVCVPVAHHVATALPVLQAGKHLLLEKPLALDLAGCDRLVESAAGNASLVTVGFNLRHHRLIRKAKHVIASGELGEIEAISSKWTSAIRYRQELPAWRNARESGGGALFEIAVHHFDLWRFLLDTDITEIHVAEKSRQWPDETVVLNARLASGTLATGLFSERTSDSNELEIFGRLGRLKISLFRYDGFEIHGTDEEPGAAARLRKLAGTLAGIPGGLAIMRKGGDFLLSYQEEWQHFLTAIETRSAPSASLADGRAAMETVLAAIQSASSGQAVAL